MDKKLLFEKITFPKFNSLLKKDKNYLIKNPDGSLSVYINNLENTAVSNEGNILYIAALLNEDGKIYVGCATKQTEKIQSFSFNILEKALENSAIVVGFFGIPMEGAFTPVFYLNKYVPNDHLVLMCKSFSFSGNSNEDTYMQIIITKDRVKILGTG